jgi:general secretion pathway protein H
MSARDHGKVIGGSGDRRGRGQALAGFSLVEVLVALTILALVAAAASTALSAAVERERFRGAAREIAAALRSARHSALAKQTEATFTLDVEDKAYNVNAAADRKLGTPRDAVLTLITASAERRAETKGTIRFFADGSSTGGSVTIALRDRSERVAVDWLTGRVQLGSAR